MVKTPIDDSRYGPCDIAGMVHVTTLTPGSECNPVTSLPPKHGSSSTSGVKVTRRYERNCRSCIRMGMRTPNTYAATTAQGCTYSRGVSHWSHGRPELDLWVALTPGGCQIGYMCDQNSTYGLRSLPGGVRFVTAYQRSFYGACSGGCRSREASGVRPIREASTVHAAVGVTPGCHSGPSGVGVTPGCQRGPSPTTTSNPPAQLNSISIIASSLLDPCTLTPPRV
jgi:hypothetical protein